MGITNNGNRFLGVFYVIISSLAFAASGTIGKKLISEEVAVYDLLFYRYLIASIFTTILVYYKRKNLRFDVLSMIKALLSAVAFYSASTYCYFKSFDYISTGLASAICFSHSLFVTFYVWLVDRQKIKKTYFLSFLLIIFGLYYSVLHHNYDIEYNLNGIAIALLSGFTYAIYIIANRNKNTNLDPIVSSLMLFIGNMFVFFVVTMQDGRVPVPSNYRSWIGLMIMGTFCTIFPIYFLLKALRYISASDVTILSILRPVFATILGIFFLGESSDITKLVGIVFILFAGILNQFDKFLSLKILNLKKTKPF